MASTARAAERFHIVLKPAEKRRWTASAAAAGLATSEYVRRAVEAYDDELRPTPAQLQEIDALLDELLTANQRADAAVDAASERVRSWGDAAWEEALRARVDDELAQSPINVDSALTDLSQVR